MFTAASPATPRTSTLWLPREAPRTPRRAQSARRVISGGENGDLGNYGTTRFSVLSTFDSGPPFRQQVSGPATQSPDGVSGLSDEQCRDTGQDLLEECEVIEVATERTDPVAIELRHRRTRHVEPPARRFDRQVVVDDQRASAIDGHMPLGDRLVANERSWRRAGPGRRASRVSAGPNRFRATSIATAQHQHRGAGDARRRLRRQPQRQRKGPGGLSDAQPRWRPRASHLRRARRWQ